jgi:hypothetical protein
LKCLDGEISDKSDPFFIALFLDQITQRDDGAESEEEATEFVVVVGIIHAMGLKDDGTGTLHKTEDKKGMIGVTTKQRFASGGYENQAFHCLVQQKRKKKV